MTSLPPSNDTFCGYRIVALPGTVRVLRTWKERLLTFPWRPFDKHTHIANPALPPAGQVYVVRQNVVGALPAIFVREEDESMLREMMRGHQSSIKVPSVTSRPPGE